MKAVDVIPDPRQGRPVQLSILQSQPRRRFFVDRFALFYLLALYSTVYWLPPSRARSCRGFDTLTPSTQSVSLAGGSPRTEHTSIRAHEEAMRMRSARLILRRLSTQAPAWNPASYTEFAQERLRPARDLMNRIPQINANMPDIIDAGCGEGGPSKLLLERFPSAKLLCLDSSRALLHVRRTKGLVPCLCPCLSPTFSPKRH